MAELIVATGLVEYNINGAFKLTINPTDSAFVEKLYAAFDALDKKQEEYRAEVQKLETAQIFEYAKARDAEMRELIDGVIGIGGSDAIYGDMNVYAYADGLPVWANLFLAILDVVDVSFAQQEKLTSPRIAKYTKKYHK